MKPTSNEILIVSADPITRSVLKAQLRSLGYRADVAHNALEALHAQEQKHYRLILMDIYLPIVDGLETAMIIRCREAKRGLRRTPIVGFSSDCARELKQNCLNIGMDDFHVLPIGLHELKAICLQSDSYSQVMPTSVGQRLAQPAVVLTAALPKLTGIFSQFKPADQRV